MKTYYKKNYHNDHLTPAKARFLLIFVVAIVFGVTSCKKFIQIPPPETKLVTASVFNNNTGATQAQTNIYVQMWNAFESYYMEFNTGLYSDELQVPNAATPGVSPIVYYTNSLVANNNYWGFWSSAYPYIYDANAVINGLQTTAGCSPAVKKQLTGEAYFIRAFWHFYLTNIYGDVPLVLTTDYNNNDRIVRTSRIQVLQQVVADLQNAQTLLNTNYVDITDTVTTSERVRPNKSAATALLARVYLYLGDYAKDATQYTNADIASTTVISNSAYGLSPLSGAGSVFQKNSSEAIWQLQTPLKSGSAGEDTPDGFEFVLTGAPLTGQFQSAIISPQLMSSFEPNDQRWTNWVGSFTTTTTPKITYYFPYKYKNRTYLNQEYVMMLRLGEQYLIRAEAEVHEGKITNAISDLNTIRQRAGLSVYAGATDQASLLTAILHERQIELFAEWGHRWLDLGRTGNAAAVMSLITPLKGGIWASDNHQLLFPISTTEIGKNPSLTQNPGY